eukprot:TRINITY_DN4689_c0_g1_i2.p1 TRINITY_DN4689_c0_g1~~TRINITY_DN4689_c0_g1_i2.p1  ORF type:complete len:173 (-),score=28.73 TRINITY_DN4689_c0_g1_i2:70-531(-)
MACVILKYHGQSENMKTRPFWKMEQLDQEFRLYSYKRLEGDYWQYNYCKLFSNGFAEMQLDNSLQYMKDYYLVEETRTGSWEAKNDGMCDFEISWTEREYEDHLTKNFKSGAWECTSLARILDGDILEIWDKGHDKVYKWNREDFDHQYADQL